jgi:hypothetical protein
MLLMLMRSVAINDALSQRWRWRIGPPEGEEPLSVEYPTLEALQAGCVAHLSFGGLAVCLEEVQCNGGCCREDSTHRAGDR